jgi:xanthine dehydrogenase YagT iron-sulfur-binding subunit
MSTNISRRELLSGTASLGAGTVLLGAGDTLAARLPQAADAMALASQPVTTKLNINGRDLRVTHDIRTTLLDALRDHLGLTGTKKGCDHGQCGACTVHIDGNTALSCLTLAIAAQNHKITSIEGLASAPDKLHPMQQAFIDCDAFQCGYCTPGQIMSAVACVKQGAAKDAASIREFMSGNLCRCAAYPNIVKAVEQGRSQVGGA